VSILFFSIIDQYYVLREIENPFFIDISCGRLKILPALLVELIAKISIFKFRN